MSVNAINDNDLVLLYLKPRKSWLVRIKKGDKAHTHAGFIEHDSIIGKEFGSAIESSVGRTFRLLKPTIADFLMRFSRPTQVVYPKDLGMIASWTGLSSGKIVVESGTGSGALTAFMANLVKPNGHVYTYEIREEFIASAKKNLQKVGLLDYVTITNKDAKEGVDVKDADVAIIDVGDPWTLVESFKNALKGSGMLAAISPTMNQAEKMTAELLDKGFVDVWSIELIARELEARVGMTRPSMRMIGHTAYITFARKGV
jgi:tRNA (adenine57-N1/adenine58-N1)-methyltransferase